MSYYKHLELDYSKKYFVNFTIKDKSQWDRGEIAN